MTGFIAFLFIQDEVVDSSYHGSAYSYWNSLVVLVSDRTFSVMKVKVAAEECVVVRKAKTPAPARNHTIMHYQLQCYFLHAHKVLGWRGANL